MRSLRGLLVAGAVVVLLGGGGDAMAHEPDDFTTPSQGRRAVLPAATPVDSFWTPDLRFVLSWTRGGLGDGEITIDAQPVDVRELGALPGGLYASGSAYRLDVSPVDGFTPAVEVQLRAPGRAVAVLQSDDGRAWRRLEVTGGDGSAIVAALDDEGYVVAAAADAQRPLWRRAAPWAAWALVAGEVVWLGIRSRARRRRRDPST